MAEKIDPSAPSSAYNIMAPRWNMIRTIMRGTEAMREARTAYLPQFEAESDAAYSSRLERTVLTNYFEDAIRNASSLPFKKPIALTVDAPSWMADFCEDVDMRGQDITRFAQDVLFDGVQAGYSFILVDYTRTAGAANRAEEKAMGARPYWVHLKADDVIAVYSEIINGAHVITHLRFLEDVIVREGFDETVVRRVRVYEPGLFEVWEEDKTKKEWHLVDSGELALPFVPIVPVFCGREEGSPFVVKPLFLDLAYKQVEHWQSASDQRNILSFARFPLLAVSGTGSDAGDEAIVGPGKMLTTSDPSGKWYYVEPTGRAIESGHKDLQELKDEMRIMGLQPIIGQPGSITATARALDETRVHSAVQVLALNLEDALNQALWLTGLWVGEETEATVSVNRDFGISLRDARELDALIRARVAGELSRRTFWDELKRRGILSTEFDPEVEEEMIVAELMAGTTPNYTGLKDYGDKIEDLDSAGKVDEINTFNELMARRDESA